MHQCDNSRNVSKSCSDERDELSMDQKRYQKNKKKTTTATKSLFSTYVVNHRLIIIIKVEINRKNWLLIESNSQ